jgi:hypothetical protein
MRRVTFGLGVVAGVPGVAGLLFGYFQLGIDEPTLGKKLRRLSRVKIRSERQ